MIIEGRRFLELAVHVKLASQAMNQAARHLATLRPEAPSEGEAEAWTRTLDELMAMNVELGLMERILRSAVRGGAGRVPKRRTIRAAVLD